MRKFVLGISAILSLHAGFTYYMAKSDSVDITGNRTNFAVANPAFEPEIASSEPYSQSLAAFLADLRSERELSPKINSERIIERSRSIGRRRDTQNARRLVTSSEAKFAPVVIRVSDFATESVPYQRPRTEYPARKTVMPTATSAVYTSSSPAPEKRNFVAKAIPIFKKPFSWLKAVGSKVF